MNNKIIPHIFRGYDIRGIYPTEVNSESFEIIGKAYGSFLHKRRIKKAVVGYDARLSSLELQKAFIKGLVTTGVDVIDIGLTLTQIMYFAQYRYLSKAGAIVTASHNPKEYNGLKLAIGYSDTLVTEEIQELLSIAQRQEFYKANKQGKVENKDVFDEYADYLQELIPLKCGLKVVIDSMNATTAKFMPTILRNAGCEVIEQNTTIDGNFPLGTPDPTESKVLKRLAQSVVKHKADLGFAYDCDGDRVGIVDSEGNVIWNDVLLAIFAKSIIKTAPDSPIVYNALCSKAVDEAIQKEGGKSIMHKTGHSFIKAKVKEARSLFGGELSGHFFFMDNFFGHDDGANASLRLLEILVENKSTLKQEVDQVPKFISSPEIKLGCSDDVKFDVVSNTLAEQIKKQFRNASFNEIDGIRMDTKDEMLIIRASLNGPYITVKFEAKTKDKYNALKATVSKLLHAQSEIDFESGVNVEEIA